MYTTAAWARCRHSHSAAVLEAGLGLSCQQQAGAGAHGMLLWTISLQQCSLQQPLATAVATSTCTALCSKAITQQLTAVCTIVNPAAHTCPADTPTQNDALLTPSSHHPLQPMPPLLPTPHAAPAAHTPAPAPAAHTGRRGVCRR